MKEEILWEDTISTEWKEALNELFNKYGNNQSTEQKLNILIKELGDCCVSYMGMGRDTPEQHEEFKYRIMALSYLENIGIYKPECC